MLENISLPGRAIYHFETATHFSNFKKIVRGWGTETKPYFLGGKSKDIYWRKVSFTRPFLCNYTDRNSCPQLSPLACSTTGTPRWSRFISSPFFILHTRQVPVLRKPGKDLNDNTNEANDYRFDKIPTEKKERLSGGEQAYKSGPSVSSKSKNTRIFQVHSHTPFTPSCVDTSRIGIFDNEYFNRGSTQQAWRFPQTRSTIWRLSSSRSFYHNCASCTMRLTGRGLV